MNAQWGFVRLIKRAKCYAHAIKRCYSSKVYFPGLGCRAFRGPTPRLGFLSASVFELIKSGEKRLQVQYSPIPRGLSHPGPSALHSFSHASCRTIDIIVTITSMVGPTLMRRIYMIMINIGARNHFASGLLAALNSTERRHNTPRLI